MVENDVFQQFLMQYQGIKAEQSSINKDELDNFNFLHFMQTNEIGLSQLFAFLLDPNQSHQQGKLFLTLFLKKLGLDVFSENFDNADVYVEHSTLKNKRHDIFIHAFQDCQTAWVMSIENKLRGACDQPDQLKDYYLDLMSYHSENYFVLYLPPYFRLPSEYSISDWHQKSDNGRKGRVWTPVELIDWLSEANQKNSNQKVKMLIDDFILFLEKEILGMTKYNTALLDLSLKNKENRELALEIFALQNNFYQALTNELRVQLKQKFDAESVFDKNEWEFMIQDEKGEYELMKLVPQHYPFVIHFEKVSGGMYYGFKWKVLNDENAKAKYQPLFQKMPLGTQSDWWGKWHWCPERELNLRFWDKKTWLGVTSGETANQIWDCVMKLWREFISVK